MAQSIGSLLATATFVALGSSSVLQAQSVVRVVDRDSMPVPFALVQVSGGQERVVDSLGRARYNKDIGASPSLLVRRLGYAPFHGRASVSPSGDFVVVLEPVAREITAVRTVAARTTTLSRTGFYDRMHRVQNGAITGSFITPEELERRKPTLISQVLHGLPSLRVQRQADGRAVVLGRGSCPMTVMLDGHRMNGLLQDAPAYRNTSINRSAQYTPPGGALSIDQITVAADIMAVEVYNSTANAPAELVPLTGGGSCGIIALWTGPRQ